MILEKIFPLNKKIAKHTLKEFLNKYGYVVFNITYCVTYCHRSLRSKY